MACLVIFIPCRGPDVNECVEGIANCTVFDVCMDTACSYECVNQESLFEQNDPSRIVLSSRYKLNDANAQRKIPLLKKQYNFQVTLKDGLAEKREKRNGKKVGGIFSVKSNTGEMMNMRYSDNSKKEIIVAMADLEPFKIPIDPKKKNQINLQVVKNGAYLLKATVNGKNVHQEQFKNPEILNDVAIEIDPEFVIDADIITANEISTDVCGEGPFLDNLWLVDGTKSWDYKDNISTAKKEFKKNRDRLKEIDAESRLGISYFSDRYRSFGRSIESVYREALPLLDPMYITDAMVDAAFDSMKSMYRGGDQPEGKNYQLYQF